MKLLAALLSLSVLAGPLCAQTAAPGTPAAPVAPKKNAPAKKTEETPKIEGMEVARGGGGFLGVAIAGGMFKITFYDAKKKPVEADVVRAALRWDPKYKVGMERVVLNLSDDKKSLTAPKNIRPPYMFKLFITLLKDAGAGEDAAGESYTIDFRG
jgi:hypothetical protein